MRNATIEKLTVTEEASFQDTVIKDVGEGVDDTDAVNKKQLDDASFGGGFNSLAWDESTGNLTASNETVPVPEVNIDGRYLTETEVQALIDNSSKSVFTIILPSASSVADRVSGAIEVPTGWTLTASGLDLEITHNLGRDCSDATVFALTGGVTKQKLFNTAAFSGLISADGNSVKIFSLATIQKQISIYILFA